MTILGWRTCLAGTDPMGAELVLDAELAEAAESTGVAELMEKAIGSESTGMVSN